TALSSPARRFSKSSVPRWRRSNGASLVKPHRSLVKAHHPPVKQKSSRNLAGRKKPSRLKVAPISLTMRSPTSIVKMPTAKQCMRAAIVLIVLPAADVRTGVVAADADTDVVVAAAAGAVDLAAVAVAVAAAVAETAKLPIIRP